MKISIDWLKEYIPVKHSVDEIANKVSLTGIESGPVKLGTDLSNLVVGHINSIKPHPDSDHLNLCQVDVGGSEDIQIVCGAPNVAQGQYVIVALDGAELPAGKKIKRGEIRGQESNGMICGLDELGVKESLVPKAYQKGIYVFPAPEKTGADAKHLLGLDDEMVDLDITPNRADTLGMHGAAWEIGATYDEKPSFTEPSIADVPVKDVDDVQVNIKADELVTDYLVRTISNVEVKESPLFIQRRLWNQGIQPVNNIIDAANYVMIEYGEPIQVYDLDKLTDKTINVEMATDGHKLDLGDKNVKDLNHEDLVINSGSTTVGLAGVIGAKNAAVTFDTKNVLVESAIFDGTSVRKAAQRHDLRGEASSRFEKGVDTGAVNVSLERTIQLISENAKLDSISQLIVGKQTPALQTVITASVSHINRLMGIELSESEMIKILDRLGFSVQQDDDDITVTIPSRRWDMTIEADLVEEIMRIYGYENLKGTLPSGNETSGGYIPVREFINKLKSVLLSEGMDETINFGLVSKQEADDFNTIESEHTRVLHPMTEDHEYLRSSLIPGLIKNIAYNKARNNSNISIFEEGRIFDRLEGTDRPKEIEYIAGALSGNIGDDTWNTSSKTVDFYDIKGIVQELLSFINIDADFEFKATDEITNMHPGQTAQIIVDDQVMGFVGKIHPEYEAKHDIDDTFVFELNVDALFGLGKKNVKAQSAPKYPSVSRDLAILVDKQIASGDIVKNIFDNGGEYLHDVNIFDVYEGSNIETGHKSLGYHLIFQNPNDTLTDDTVEKAFTQIKTGLINQFNVEVR
ncbi:phenylalanine--tRNA ligase subunit beta [Companilactobacillus sp.]|jgi:phenylalanyl-tRNA synthetase beta chain|uniref:phenylalanine--tRNA ligase subunit beta n=1 Tax=Companilactobacillus sp. TaxID=2767905 RepID=UPI0025BC749D|nr:phenylalanine--tRNA ligase subunit beta [Companilactobacillus sp.]MCH4008001.1 phenylalanine--tRNA ligase subunit beta [Companilactobacillus sp.]MCH4051820.1 phenylalanine--tRNA ligase subunit beta [Companilactobacillus sp.]MCH4075944.1 phenylalanine--tRNA ligase subunit beta [Companilactobacillus sp.]MCH4124519.1 phenylalanine--tRNA ligase subunit beta [Companilactobacillus sp.]MCH4132518.1 phenylalanine--tRNA ligase subunit beta [Companilactobacillus sp.]